MSKRFFLSVTSVFLLIFGANAFAATNASNATTKASNARSTAKKNLTSNFTKGSIVSGTTGTGSVRRWFFFNEGAVGSSYTWLGRSNYISVDVGYNLYLRSIESVLGGTNFMIGTEISVPIFIKPFSGSRSNVLSDHRYLETKEFDGVAGSGIQVPLMMGFEYRGFYIMGFGGYTWLWMNDTYASNAVGSYPTIKSMYDGVIYGGGIGYKVSNIVNIGVRYTGGFLTNRIQQLQAGSLLGDTISHATGRDIYDIPYHRISVFISLIY